MGFFSKLGNFLRGKGWKEPTKKKVEEVTQPEKVRVTTEREREKVTEKVKEIDEVLEPTETPEEKAERIEALRSIPKEQRTEQAKEELKEAEEEREIRETSIEEGMESLGRIPKNLKRPSIDEVNARVNEAMQSAEGYQEVFINGLMTDGNTYGNLMKEAIMRSGAKIDENIAELIATNYDKFRYRFTTNLEILLETEEQEIKTAKIICFGTSPIDIGNILTELEINEGETISSSEIYKKLQKIIETLRENQKTMNTSNPLVPEIRGTATIRNIRLSTHFR